jgi:hypothetical protein
VAPVLKLVAAGAVAGLLLVAAPCVAQTWGAVTCCSYHTDRTAGYNEHNGGLGLEHVLGENWSALGGFYDNSFHRTTVYAGAAYTPLRVSVFKAGVAAFAATGYEYPIVPAAAAVLEMEYERVGANLLFIPHSRWAPGVVGLQLKVRFQ